MSNAIDPVSSECNDDRPDDRRLLQPLVQHLLALAPAGRTARPRGAGTYADRRIDAYTFSRLTPLDALPPQTRASQEAVRAAAARLETRLARAPLARELAAELGWKLSELFHCMHAAGAGGLRASDPPVESLDDMPSPGGDDAPAPARSAGALESRCTTAPEQLTALGAAFDHLCVNEQLVLRMMCEQGMPLDRVARMLVTQRDTVERLHDEAVAKLSQYLQPVYGGAAGLRPAATR